MEGKAVFIRVLVVLAVGLAVQGFSPLGRSRGSSSLMMAGSKKKVGKSNGLLQLSTAFYLA